MAKISYKIGGMTCVNCAQNIEQSFKNKPNIHSSSVNFTLEIGTFEGDINEPGVTQTIEDTLESLGHTFTPFDGETQNDDAEDQTKDLKTFTLSTILSLGILYFNMGPGKNLVSLKTSWMIQFFLSTPIWIFVGLPFQKALVHFIKSGQSNMNTLIGLGTSVAYIYSSILTLSSFFFDHSFKSFNLYFEAVGFIISFVFLGKVFEKKAKKKAKESLDALFKLQSKNALLLEGNTESFIPLNQVKRGHILRVKPGDKIPVDGKILRGISHIDESSMTGESIPVLKEKKGKVFAGTINLDGVLDFKATKVGKETFLSRLSQFVEEAQLKKAPIQRYADKISSYFVPFILIIAFLTFLSWVYFDSSPHSFSDALAKMIAVLVIACPCALGLATPTAVVVSTGEASKQGILISGGDIIEASSSIDHIIFDKTGTLTEGKPLVEKVLYLIDKRDFPEREVNSLCRYSEHPLSHSIHLFFKDKNVSHYDPEKFEVLPGRGIQGTINNSNFLIGSEALMKEQNIDLPELGKGFDRITSQVFIAQNEKVIGVFLLKDKLKVGVKKTIQQIQNLGFKITLLSGDNEETTRWVAKELNLNQYLAKASPFEKANFIKNLQNKNSKVIMVGDGINDGPALSQANISISMGTGTDLAISASDITIVKGDIEKVHLFLLLSKRTMSIIRQNLFLSFIYNTLCIPLAAGLFQPLLGWSFPPLFASLAMGLSSLSVVLNSLRIKKGLTI